MTTSDIKGFAQQFPFKNLDEKEMLMYSDEDPSLIFYLDKGYVRQFVESKDGKELTIHIFESGAVFPIAWALAGSKFDYNLQAITRSKIFLIPEQEIIKFLNSNPKELMAITIRLSRGLEGLSKRIQINNFSNAREKVVAILEYLNRHFGNKFSFSHEDISSLTGLSRERVSIEMKKLKDEKKINYKHGKVTFITDSLPR